MQSSETGRVERIWIKRSHGGVMDSVEKARLVTGLGIATSADQGGKRQVTLMSRDRWDELMQELSATLDPSVRRANLFVSGIDLVNSRGRFLRIGQNLLRIRGETRPCRLMDEAHPGLQAAMKSRWGGGAFAEVLEGGEIAVGDPVAWADAETAPGSSR